MDNYGTVDNPAWITTVFCALMKYDYFKPNADFSGGKSKNVEMKCILNKDSESHIYY